MARGMVDVEGMVGALNRAIDESFSVKGLYSGATSGMRNARHELITHSMLGRSKLHVGDSRMIDVANVRIIEFAPEARGKHVLTKFIESQHGRGRSVLITALTNRAVFDAFAARARRGEPIFAKGWNVPGFIRADKVTMGDNDDINVLFPCDRDMDIVLECEDRALGIIRKIHERVHERDGDNV